MRGGSGLGKNSGAKRRILRVPGQGAPLFASPLFRIPLVSLVAAAASVMAAPTMVRAFSSSSDQVAVSLAARGALGSFTPATVDPRLMTPGALRALSHGRLFRFTPAGTDNRPDRAVTVVVRVSGPHDRVFANRGLQGEAPAGFASVRIAPIAYNLGLARGYQSFALAATAPIHDLARDNSDLRTFSLANTVATPQSAANASGDAKVRGASPRLAADVSLDERAAPGRSPRTLGTQGDYQVDMGGSYRLIGNLAVTAGLRYATDRDRLSALSDHRQDSQAIYVGTKFRF